MGVRKGNTTQTAHYAARFSKRHEKHFVQEIFDTDESDYTDGALKIGIAGNKEEIFSRKYHREGMLKLIAEHPETCFKIEDLAKIFEIETVGQWEEFYEGLCDYQEAGVISVWIQELSDGGAWWLVTKKREIIGEEDGGVIYAWEPSFRNQLIWGLTGVRVVDKESKVKRNVIIFDNWVENVKEGFRKWLRKIHGIGKRKVSW